MAFPHAKSSTNSSFLRNNKDSQTPVGRPIISGCDGPTEWLSSFVDQLSQPIGQLQDLYLKDTTDFIKKTKLPQNAILASVDVTSLYTNIPQEDGITTVCQAYEAFVYINPPPPLPTRYLREMLKSRKVKSTLFRQGSPISHWLLSKGALRKS